MIRSNASTTSLSRKLRSNLKIEQLETREVPAAYLASGSLMITGTSTNNNVTVASFNSGGVPMVRVTQDGAITNFTRASIATNRVYFYGYAGNDYFNNTVSSINVIAYGGTGNDTLWGDAMTDWLYGEAGNDTIYGWSGNDVVDGGTGNDVLRGNSGTDWLYGGDGNDRLYGQAGTDYLYGQNGDDFMDAGSAGEYANGGAGYDFNAYIVAVSGATYTDIRQGGSPTCWLVSAISAVAHRGTNLAARITYVSENTYRVGLYNTSGIWTTTNVTFDGTLNGADAVCNPSQEGETWVMLTQRAVLQTRGISLTSPGGGWATTTFLALLGNAGTTVDRSGSEMSTAQRTQLVDALNAGRRVIADTADTAAGLSTNTLVAWHQYTVLGYEVSYRWEFGGLWNLVPILVADYTFIVRNPWGYDGGTATGDTTDGVVRLSWNDFSRSMDAIIIA